MYLDFLVKIPFVQGKITRRKKKDVVYIEYEYDRIYDPVRQYTFPKRVTIGKLSETDPELMQPNQNFLKFFPDAELPETKNRTSRSSCLRVGAYFLLRKIIEEYNLVEFLGGYFEQCDLGLFLDLAVYSIIAENNAAQYYPDYIYNHPLFTNGMKQYSDSSVSDFLNSVTDDQSIGFLTHGMRPETIVKKYIFPTILRTKTARSRNRPRSRCSKYPPRSSTMLYSSIILRNTKYAPTRRQLLLDVLFFFSGSSASGKYFRKF